MRVQIWHQEQTRWLVGTTKAVIVIVEVVLTDAEHVIIRNRGLADFVVLERAPPKHVAARFSPDELRLHAPRFYLRVHDILAGVDRYSCDTPAEAKAYERRLIDALQDLKTFIDANAEIGDATVLDL